MQFVHIFYSSYFIHLCRDLERAQNALWKELQIRNARWRGFRNALRKDFQSTTISASAAHCCALAHERHVTEQHFGSTTGIYG